MLPAVPDLPAVPELTGVTDLPAAPALLVGPDPPLVPELPDVTEPQVDPLVLVTPDIAVPIVHTASKNTASDNDTIVTTDFHILDDEYLKSQYESEMSRSELKSFTTSVSSTNNIVSHTSIGISSVEDKAQENSSKKRKTPYRATGYARVIENVANTGISRIANMETSKIMYPRPHKIDIPSLSCNLSNSAKAPNNPLRGDSRSPRRKMGYYETGHKERAPKISRRSPSDPPSPNRRHRYICRRSRSPKKRSRDRSTLSNSSAHRSLSTDPSTVPPKRQPADEKSSSTVILSELLDLSKTVTSLQSRIVELEKKNEAMRLIMIGGTATSESSRDAVNRTSSHNRARLEVEDSKQRQQSDRRKRDRDSYYRSSRSRSRSRNHQAYITFPVLGDGSSVNTTASWWTCGATMAMLLLIFVCEEAITLPHYKLFVRAIFSVLALLLIGGLRSDNSRENVDSRQKLQLINELSSKVASVTQEPPEDPAVIMPILNDSDDSDDSVPIQNLGDYIPTTYEGGNPFPNHRVHGLYQEKEATPSHGELR